MIYTVHTWHYTPLDSQISIVHHTALCLDSSCQVMFLSWRVIVCPVHKGCIIFDLSTHPINLSFHLSLEFYLSASLPQSCLPQLYMPQLYIPWQVHVYIYIQSQQSTSICDYSTLSLVKLSLLYDIASNYIRSVLEPHCKIPMKILHLTIICSQGNSQLHLNVNIQCHL